MKRLDDCHDPTWSIEPQSGTVPDMVQLLSMSQVAQRLSISRRAAFTLAKRPGFPAAIRLSARCVRYAEEDIARWVEDQRQRG